MNKLKKLDYYIIGILTATLIFTGVMVWMFWERGYVPDSLINSWFVYICGELLCCTLIKTVEERQNARKEVLEDREYFDKKEREQNERN